LRDRGALVEEASECRTATASVGPAGPSDQSAHSNNTGMTDNMSLFPLNLPSIAGEQSTREQGNSDFDFGICGYPAQLSPEQSNNRKSLSSNWGEDPSLESRSEAQTNNVTEQETWCTNTNKSQPRRSWRNQERVTVNTWGERTDDLTSAYSGSRHPSTISEDDRTMNTRAVWDQMLDDVSSVGATSNQTSKAGNVTR